MKRSLTQEGKIIEHSKALGTVTAEMVENRAREIAVINGRTAQTMTDGDRQQARDELSGVNHLGSSNEDRDAAASTRPWDPVPGTQGHSAPKQLADDEQTVNEQLAEEGMAEAEHDRMITASKPSGQS